MEHEPDLDTIHSGEIGQIPFIVTQTTKRLPDSAITIHIHIPLVGYRTPCTKSWIPNFRSPVILIREIAPVFVIQIDHHIHPDFLILANLR